MIFVNTVEDARAVALWLRIRRAFGNGEQRDTESPVANDNRCSDAAPLHACGQIPGAGCDSRPGRTYAGGDDATR